MPIYEYCCAACSHNFTHFFSSIREGQETAPPTCPACGKPEARRVISRVAIGGGRGGTDAGADRGERSTGERPGSITSRETIEKLRAGKAKT